MFQPLYVAATGLNAFQDEMTDITNNLSNARTVGFKKGRTEKESMFYTEKDFSKYLSDAITDQNAVKATEYGTGVRVVSTPKDFTQGSIETTGNPLDVAIEGEGFFQLKMADGTNVYSRAGNFHADNEGNIVDPNGRLLDPPIVLPQGTTSVLIKTDGTVYAATNNSLSMSQVGQISLAKFANPSGLKALGQNIYAASASSGEPIIGSAGDEGFGSIQQSSLEQSNVDVVSEMMRMIMIQRVFDTVTKAVQSYEGMLTSVERMKS